MIADKKIILGVCGSIAAYKSAILTRLLIKAEAEVQVIITPDASAFIGAVTLSALSKKPVLCKSTEDPGARWVNHVELGLWADLLLIAPATSNTLAKFAHGLCDNLLCAVYLSARCPVFVAPAMDLDMLQHPATRHNLSLLESYGNHIIAPGVGELASGLYGEGRLAEPQVIFDIVDQYFNNPADSVT